MNIETVPVAVECAYQTIFLFLRHIRGVVLRVLLDEWRSLGCILVLKGRSSLLNLFSIEWVVLEIFGEPSHRTVEEQTVWVAKLLQPATCALSQTPSFSCILSRF